MWSDLHQRSSTGKSREIEGRLVAAGSERWGEWGEAPHGTVLFGNWMEVIVVHHCECNPCHWVMHTLKCLILCYVNFTAERKNPGHCRSGVGTVYQLEKGVAWPTASVWALWVPASPRGPVPLLTSETVPRVSREERILHHVKQLFPSGPTWPCKSLSWMRDSKGQKLLLSYSFNCLDR